jgi:hypothetical protein
MTQEELDEQRKEKHKLRMMKTRKRMTRAEYIARVSTGESWHAAGMSKASDLKDETLQEYDAVPRKDE